MYEDFRPIYELMIPKKTPGNTRQYPELAQVYKRYPGFLAAWLSDARTAHAWEVRLLWR